MSPDSLVRCIDETYSIEILNEPTYTFGSADHSRRYMREEIFGDHRYLVSSRHSVLCTCNAETLASVIFGAVGGADFNSDTYVFDLETGKVVSSSA